MSTSHGHYTAPSAIPADYALVARYATHQQERHAAGNYHANAQDNAHDIYDPAVPNHDPDDAPNPFTDEGGEDDRGAEEDFEATLNEETPLFHPSGLRSSLPASQEYYTFGPPPDARMDHALLKKHSHGRLRSQDVLPSENTPLLLSAPPAVPRIAEDEVSTGSEAGTIVNGGEEAAGHGPRKWSTYREEMWILVKYTLPVFGTHLLEYSLIVASVISIGHLSTTALAASSLGSMTASVSGYSIIQGMVSALDTILPSAWTSPQPNLVGLWAQRMMVVLLALLIPISAIWFSSEPLLLFLRQDPEVAHLAALYLRYAVIGLPAYCFNNVSRRYFQSQGLFTVPTRIILVIAPINVFLNWLLVWGPESIRLGFIGAPIATAISFWLISLASITYGAVYVPRTAWHPVSARSLRGLDVIVRLGLGGVGQTASEWWSWELVGLAASLLGPVALATQSVLLVSASTTYQAPFALSVAASVRIGNLLGQRNAPRAKVAAESAMLIGLGIAVILSTILMTFRKSWGYIFNDDPEVVSLVAGILPLVALFQMFDGTVATTAGILRARGKQLTGAVLNLSAYYVLGIPLGLFLTFRCNMGLLGLWTGLTAALVYCACIAVWLCLRSDWDREVKKVEERLAADKYDEERRGGGGHVDGGV